MIYDDQIDQWFNAALLAKDVNNIDEFVEIKVPNDIVLPRSPECTAIPSQLVIALSESERLLQNETSVTMLRFFVESNRSFRILKPYTTQPTVVKGITNNANKRIACESWHEFDLGVNTLSLPPCPCTREQAEHDDRFVLESRYLSKANVESFKKTPICYTLSSITLVQYIIILSSVM